MVQLMETFPGLESPHGIGSQNSRKAVRDMCYIAHYRETRKDMYTNKAPSAVNMAWLREQLWFAEDGVVTPQGTGAASPDGRDLPAQ